MVRLGVEDIAEIHRRSIERWGGDGTIRPETMNGVDGALGAALFASMQNEAGEPDPLAYASGILAYLGRAQHFVDGNKRAAWGGCVRALAVNGLMVRAETDEIIKFMDDVVNKKLSVQDVADQLGAWLDVV